MTRRRRRRRRAGTPVHNGFARPDLDFVPGPPRTIAVVSDCTGPPRHKSRGRWVSTPMALRDDAALIEGLTGLRAVTLICDGAIDLADQLRRLPEEITTIFLTRTDPGRAHTAQRALEQTPGRVVVTDEDAAAIALTAALLTYLARSDISPSSARVLIAGAVRMPILTPLLWASGVHTVLLWNEIDAPGFPLRHVVRDATAVLDLLEGPALVEIAQDRPAGSVINLRHTETLVLVAGLLKAAAESCAPHPQIGLDVLHACAVTLLIATPPGRHLPDLAPDQELARTVAAGAARVIDGSSRPRGGYPPAVRAIAARDQVPVPPQQRTGSEACD